MIDLKGIILLLFSTLLFSTLKSQENRGASVWPGMTKTLTYKEVAGKELKLDLMYPGNRLPERLKPIHVFVHGGGFNGGWRHSFDQAEQIKVFQILAKKGYVGVSIDYRLVNEKDSITIDHSVRDCKDAIRFLYSRSEQLKINPSRISIWGSSAGGHLALMTGLTNDDKFRGDERLSKYPCPVKCMVSWYGVTDFVNPELAGPHISGYDERFGSPRSEFKETRIRKKLSPMNYLSGNSVPVLCVHGMNDPIVPFAQSLYLAKKAREIGTKVSLISVLNTGHGWSRENKNLIPSSDELAKITADFMEYYLQDSW